MLFSYSQNQTCTQSNKRLYTINDVCKHYFEPYKENNTLLFHILPPLKNTPLENSTKDNALAET